MERIIIIDDLNCKEELQKFLEANKQHIRINTSVEDLKNTSKFFIEELTGNFELGNKLAVNTDKQVNILHTKEIIYIEAAGTKSKLHLKNDKNLEATTDIDSYESKLEHSNFIRIHDNFIVNLDYFLKFNFKNTNEVELINGTNLPVDSNRKDLLINQIENINKI
jgi:DNA-binding LytR/AlgR family response regulator